MALAVPWFALAARAIPQFLKFFFIREHFPAPGCGFAIMRPSTREQLSASGVPMREIARFAERVIISRR